jgi:hypothetical protein
VEHNRAAIFSRLDEVVFRAEYELGQKMPLTQVFASALDEN